MPDPLVHLGCFMPLWWLSSALNKTGLIILRISPALGNLQVMWKCHRDSYTTTAISSSEQWRGISPRPIDFLLPRLWASGTDEGHPRASAVCAKEKPEPGTAPGPLLGNNLVRLSLNQTWNAYGLVWMLHSRSPWLMALENISSCFPKPSFLQEYKGHGDVLSLRISVSSQKKTRACHCHPEQSHSTGTPSPECFSYTEAAHEGSLSPMSQAVGAPLQTRTASFRANFSSSYTRCLEVASIEHRSGWAAHRFVL